MLGAVDWERALLPAEGCPGARLALAACGETQQKRAGTAAPGAASQRIPSPPRTWISQVRGTEHKRPSVVRASRRAGRALGYMLPRAGRTLAGKRIAAQGGTAGVLQDGECLHVTHLKAGLRARAGRSYATMLQT